MTEASPIATWDPISGSRTALPHRAKTLVNEVTQVLAPHRVGSGVFEHLKTEALAAYDRIIGLDLSEVALDGSLHKAPCGGEGTGANPTDRAKLGWKWSVAVDAQGIPLGWAIDGANRNDLKL